MDIEATIIHAMARALFVQAYAAKEEEEGRPICQQDWMDVAPATPRYAIEQAYRLAGQIELLNGHGDIGTYLVCLFAKACRADDISYKSIEDVEEPYAEEFGHYLAMESLGHGVGWFDCHAKFPLELPRFEFELEDEDPCPTLEEALRALREVETCISVGSIDDNEVKQSTLGHLRRVLRMEQEGVAK